MNLEAWHIRSIRAAILLALWASGTEVILRVADAACHNPSVWSFWICATSTGLAYREGSAKSLARTTGKSFSFAFEEALYFGVGHVHRGSLATFPAAGPTLGKATDTTGRFVGKAPPLALVL